MPSETYNPDLHGPKRVQEVFFGIKSGLYPEKHPLARVLAAGRIIVGGILIAGGANQFGPPVLDGLKAVAGKIIDADNRVFARTGRMYDDYPIRPSYQQRPFFPKLEVKDYLKLVIAEHLRPSLGNNFQVLKEELYFAQSMAMSEDGEPIGHYYYNFPVRKPENVIPDAYIEYGKEVPVQYFLITPGKFRPSIWIVSSRADQNTGRLQLMFANDLDGNDGRQERGHQRWSFGYKRAGDPEKKYVTGDWLFILSQRTDLSSY